MTMRLLPPCSACVPSGCGEKESVGNAYYTGPTHLSLPSAEAGGAAGGAPQHDGRACGCVAECA